MKMAFIVVVVLALMPQIAFTILYWRWIPSWIRNPYGRLAMLGSWSIIITLSLCLILAVLFRDLGREALRGVFAFGFMPMAAFGYFQLFLLKKTVDSARASRAEEERSNDR